MDSRLGILSVLAIFALAVLVPTVDADAEDSTLFSYKSQLDENSTLVYNEVGKAVTFDGESKTFTVAFSDSTLYSSADKARTYADAAVQNALAASYLSNPMILYLWDYPVKAVEVTTDLQELTVNDGSGLTYYKILSVTFTLTLPEGITEASIIELNDAIKTLNFNGKTNANTVSSMISYLKGISYQADEDDRISNIYDAVVKKKSSSAGVAQALTWFCMNSNIPSIIVAGDNITCDTELKSFWNYVYLEGDHDGLTYYAWYIVDAAHNPSAGIAGYQTTIEYGDKTYSLSAALTTDLNLSSPNDLRVPQVNDNKYVQVGGPTFLERYGENILLLVLGAILVVGMLYAVRSGNF